MSWNDCLSSLIRYFLGCANFFFYGESITDYFNGNPNPPVDDESEVNPASFSPVHFKVFGHINLWWRILVPRRRTYLPELYCTLGKPTFPITLQKLLNCLHEKQNVGSTRRVTCHVNLVKARLLEHVQTLMAQQRGQPFLPINTHLSRLSSEGDLLSRDNFPTYKLDLVCKVCAWLSGLENVTVFWVLVSYVCAKSFHNIFFFLW